MPLYEFHCSKCNGDSEILVRSADWQGTKCPHCGSTKLAKKFSTFAASTTTGSSQGGAPACASGGGGCCGGHCGGH